MLRLKLENSFFLPSRIYSFSLRNPSDEEISSIKEAALSWKLKEDKISFTICDVPPDGLPVWQEVRDIINFCDKDSWVIELPRGRKLEKKGKPLIMGILNVTPDSFYDGGRYVSEESAVERALIMEDQGADIIDVGGESTRPGSEGISEEEELERVIPVIEGIRKYSDIPISIDTTKSAVALRAIEAGADMVNDISGFRFDDRMPRVVSQKKVPAVIMHTTGKPKDMQKRIDYKDVIWDILDYLSEGLEIAERNGIAKERIIVDPGIGFGKRPEDNLVIINRLPEFKSLKRPVLIGASRKSFIGKALSLESPEERLEGSLAVYAISIVKGVDILRVHDVRETRMVVDMIYHVITEGACSRF